MLLFYLATLETDVERVKMTELYEEYSLRLMHIALNYTKNHSTSEELVHETFMKAIENKEKVLSMSSREFFHWSVVVIKNKCIDLYRKDKQIAQIPLDEIEKQFFLTIYLLILK